MRTRYSLITIVLAALLWLAVPHVATAQTPGDDTVVPSGQGHNGNIATVTQDIIVDGTVVGDVTSWSGNITINGRVQGDVVSYAGRIMIAPQAQIGGHVLALNTLDQQDGAQVGGHAMHGTRSSARLASLVGLFAPRSDARTTAVLALQRAVFGAAMGVFLLTFSLLWAALWPRRTTAATLTLLGLPWRAAAHGLLTTALVALLLLPVSALLSATLVGLPMLVLLLLVVNLPYVYGFAVTAHALAAGRANNVHVVEHGVNQRAFVVAALLALMVAVVGAFAPLAGLALLYIVASPGLGAAILSRGGLVVPEMAVR